MKIGAFTILTIIVFIILIFSVYMEKRVLNMQNDLCQEMRPNESHPIENFSDASWNLLQKCYIERQISIARYSLKSDIAFIFFWLILISWRIDSLEKH